MRVTAIVLTAALLGCSEIPTGPQLSSPHEVFLQYATGYSTNASADSALLVKVTGNTPTLYPLLQAMTISTVVPAEELLAGTRATSVKDLTEYQCGGIATLNISIAGTATLADEQFIASIPAFHTSPDVIFTSEIWADISVTNFPAINLLQSNPRIVAANFLFGCAVGQ